jgi:hypothetical protein
MTTLAECRRGANARRARYLLGCKEDLGGLVTKDDVAEYANMPIGEDWSPFAFLNTKTGKAEYVTPRFDYHRILYTKEVSALSDGPAYRPFYRMNEAVVKLIAKYKLVVAGGNAASVYNRSGYGDVDIYIPDGTELNDVITEFISIPNTSLIRSKLAITSYITGDQYQLVLATFANLSQLLHCFDIPAAAIAINAAGNFSATKEAIWQLCHNCVIFDHDHISYNYGARLRKYRVKDMMILFPRYAGELGGEIVKPGCHGDYGGDIDRLTSEIIRYVVHGTPVELCGGNVSAEELLAGRSAFRTYEPICSKINKLIPNPMTEDEVRVVVRGLHLGWIEQTSIHMLSRTAKDNATDEQKHHWYGRSPDFYSGFPLEINGLIGEYTGEYFGNLVCSEPHLVKSASDRVVIIHGQRVYYRRKRMIGDGIDAVISKFDELEMTDENVALIKAMVELGVTNGTIRAIPYV